MEEPLKILIVEDEMIIAMYYREALKARGFYVCKLASNSDAALDVFREEGPDIVLMDIGLPHGLDGIETVKIMMQERPGMPVIYVTSYEDGHIRSRAMATEPVEYFTKPADIDEISRTIRANFARET